MSDNDNWMVPKVKRRKTKSTNIKKVYMNHNELLSSIELQNIEFKGLSDIEKDRKSKEILNNVVSRAIELIDNDYILNHLNTLEKTGIYINYNSIESSISLDSQLPAWELRLNTAISEKIQSKNTISEESEGVLSSLSFASCLGIGPIGTSNVSIQQLAYFLLICLFSRLPRRYCEVYDPILTDLERYVLHHHLGFNVPKNTEGHTSINEAKSTYQVDSDCKVNKDAPALIYLPHCGTGITCNVLHANWRELEQVVVVCNDADKALATTYLPCVDTNTVPDSTKHLVSLSTNNTYLSSLFHVSHSTPNIWVALGRVLPWITQISFPTPSNVFKYAFNDTAYHVFRNIPQAIMNSLPPKYQVNVQNRNGITSVDCPEIIPASIKH